MRLVKIEGRFRRVLSEAGGVAQVVVGTRVQRAIAKTRPAMGWASDPTVTRGWTKNHDIVEPRTVQRGDILEMTDWPSGAKDNGLEPHEYLGILKPLIELHRGLPGNSGRKDPPTIALETIEVPVKREGLAMPTQDELEDMIDALWERPRHERRSARSNGRGIIPQPKKPDPEPAPPPGVDPVVASTVPPNVNPEQEHILEAKPAKPTTGADNTVIDAGDLGIIGDKELVDGLPKEGTITPAAEKPAEIPDGHFYSEHLKLVLPETDDNRLSDQAAGNGWPIEFLTDASRSKKGLAGFTLAFMTKNQFDLETHSKSAITGGSKKS